MESGFIALPLLAKACIVWFCIVHIMQKLPWAPGAGETTRHQGQTQERWKQNRDLWSNTAQPRSVFPMSLMLQDMGTSLCHPKWHSPSQDQPRQLPR